MASEETITAGELYQQCLDEVAKNPDRRPVEVRLEEMSHNAILCMPRKHKGPPTHEDLDAVEAMTLFLAAAATMRRVDDGPAPGQR